MEPPWHSSSSSSELSSGRMVREEQHGSLEQHSEWQKVLNKGRNTDLSPIEDAVGGRKAMVMGVTGN